MARQKFTQIDLMLLNLDDGFAFTCNEMCRDLGYGLLITVGLIVFCILVVRLTCSKVDKGISTMATETTCTLTDSMLVKGDQSEFIGDESKDLGYGITSTMETQTTCTQNKSLLVNDDQSDSSTDDESRYPLYGITQVHTSTVVTETYTHTDSLLLVNDDQSKFTDDAIKDLVHGNTQVHTISAMTTETCTHTDSVLVNDDHSAGFTDEKNKDLGYGSNTQVHTLAMATDNQCIHTNLKLVNLDDQFVYTCNGCREVGYGSCYTCHNTQCNYHLHEDCHMPQSIISHPFITQGHFVLNQNDEPPQNLLLCEACGMSVQGWRYELGIKGDTEITLHPCCINLPYSQGANDSSYILTAKNLESHNLCCAHCNHQSNNETQGWAYIITSSNLAFHVKCMKEMRHQIWEKNYYSANHHNESNLQDVHQQAAGLDTSFQDVHEQGCVQKRFRKRQIFIGLAKYALSSLARYALEDML